MNIALIGYGAMGKTVENIASAGGHQISVIVNENHKDLEAERLADTLRSADVAIDFSAAPAVARNVRACMLAGVSLVEGTTGWKEERRSIEEMVNEANGAFVFGANFSIGVNVFYRIADFASGLIAKFPGYEVFIEEQHHSKKKDAPSGTALKLREIVAANIAEECGVTSTRAGNIPGTHRVGFDGTADQILLEHSARSREGFAAGAIMAAEWIMGTKGFYDFSDVIDEILEE